MNLQDMWRRLREALEQFRGRAREALTPQPAPVPIPVRVGRQGR